MNKVAIFAMLTTCVFFNACSRTPTESTPDNPAPGQNVDVQPSACNALPLDACAAAGCNVVSATRYEVDRVCRHPTEPVSCLSADRVCPMAITYARDLEGNTWVFVDGCTGPGWLRFQEDEADWKAAKGPLCSSKVECSQLSLDACAAAGCSVVSATRYEADKVCKHPAEPVSCLPADVGCTEVETYARDLEGNTWFFSHGCTPTGWQHFQADEADTKAVQGDLCGG